MNHDVFEEIIETQLELCRSMLVRKNKEYATDDDKLHNFDVASSILGNSQIQALGGMMVKHTVSVYDMIESDDEFTLQMWEEKITDHINYLLLLKAAVMEDLGLKKVIRKILPPKDDI